MTAFAMVKEAASELRLIPVAIRLYEWILRK